MRTRCLAVALLAACSAPRPRTGSGDALLIVQGRVVGGAARFGAQDLARLDRRSFTARDPSGQERTYAGIALAKLLGEELELERGGDTVVVHGARGYEAVVPLPLLRQHRPILADQLDGAPLAQARPSAAPLALAWPSSDWPGLKHDPRARGWWVDGVSRIEVLSWTGTYGRALRVPAGSPDPARPGADAFQTACMSCHRLRGTGGTRGPELTDRLGAASPRDGFLAAVRAHTSIADAAQAAELPEETVAQIASFLRAVAVAGPLSPQEEPPPEPLPAPRPAGMGPVRPPGT